MLYIIKRRWSCMPRGKKRKTHEEYIKEVSKINSDIEVVGKYIDAKTKILHRCKIDNYEWMATPSKILVGRGCPKCAGNMKKTHEEYVAEARKVNPYIEVVGKYNGALTKILHKCKKDGYEWYVSPHNVLQGQSCPRCSGVERYSHEEYVKRVAKVNPNVEVLGKYIDSKTKILHRCKIDGYEWSAFPSVVLQGGGCPKCAGNAKITHEEYIIQVAKVNPSIEVLERYAGYHTKILHKCKTDGYEWYASPSNILHGFGCPKCNTSKGEKAIEEWINKQNILYESQKRFFDCRDKKPLPFDFYLPEYDICIEYQGQQHYESIKYFGGKSKFEDQIKKDNIKKEYCKKNNILLIEIPYYFDLNKELVNLYDLIKVKHMEKEVVV